MFKRYKLPYEDSTYEFISHQIGSFNLLELYAKLSKDNTHWVNTPSDFKTYILEKALEDVGNLIREQLKEDNN
jgi:hypothetical protein